MTNVKPLPQSFSIMCDTCESMLEYSTHHGIILFLTHHPKQCPGPQKADSPLTQAYEDYLATQPHEKQMDHLSERLKHTLRKTL